MSVLLAALLLLLQAAPRPGSIEGYVVRAGTNPPVALVNARLELAGPGPALVARTDPAGRFVFSNLTPGRYRLHVTKDGYLRKEYRQPALVMPGLPIDLKPELQLGGIVFAMDPAPTISGRVLDPAGSPIANVVVEALRRTYDTRGNRTLSLAASAMTDDRGSYRLYWLDPGEYFIAATRPPLRSASPSAQITTFMRTYYPAFVELDEAKPIRLEMDRDLTGVDVALLPQAPLAVNIYATSLATGRPVGANVVLAPPGDSAGVTRYQGRTAPLSGTLTLQGVVPGPYVVTATGPDGTAAQRSYLRNSNLRFDLRLSPGTAINGVLFNAENRSMDLGEVRIRLAESDTALPGPRPAAVSPANRFSIPAVQAGTYSVEVSGLPGDFYLKAAEFNSQDALSRPISILSPESPVPELRIQIGLDGGRVSGAVFDRVDRLFAGAQVILAPENRSRYDLFRYASTMEDGAFTLRGIAPGDYKLFAWDSLEANAHLNVEYMRAYEELGSQVRVVPGDNPPASLRLIRAPQF